MNNARRTVADHWDGWLRMAAYGYALGYVCARLRGWL